jgi:hypothetical protein
VAAWRHGSAQQVHHEARTPHDDITRFRNKPPLLAYGQKINLRRPARSRRFAMVIAQEPTQSLAALHGSLTTNVRIPREEQDVALPLVISLSVEMLDIFAQRSPQRALAKEDHLAQALLLHRPDPATSIPMGKPDQAAGDFFSSLLVSWQYLD